MTARVSSEMVCGFEAVVLENRYLRAVIIPDLGGRVWELEDRVRRRQWIWHRPDVPLQSMPPGSIYDDVWAGGWEELFPNDAPGEFEGRKLPDHGEWWAMRWTVASTAEGDIAELTLTAESTFVRAACVKKFRLASDEGTLSVTYSIRSKEDRPFHFLFKQHLPIAVSPECRLQLPGGRVEPVDPEFSSLLTSGEPFDWPSASGAIHLQGIPPPSSRLQEFVYVSNLPEGWCGVEDRMAGAALRMDFDRVGFPFVWLFLTYGGWRGLYTAVLEPCTNMPKDLAKAVERNQSAMLLPGQEFVTNVAVTLYGRTESAT